MKNTQKGVRKELIKLLLDFAGELASQIEEEEKQPKIKKFLRKKSSAPRFRSAW